MALLMTMAALAVPAGVQPPPPVALPRDCTHVHRKRSAKRGLRHHLHNFRPLVRTDRVKHFAACVRTRGLAHRLHRYARRLLAWRRSYGPKWRIAFNRLPAWAQAWARSTSYCETGGTMNPATNTGNSFYGAFQFLPSTWWAAGGTGMPHQHSWHYQAVIAVRWLYRAGDEQWPVCGD
jgi:hypothetical protein